jgi:hypothetical protein
VARANRSRIILASRQQSWFRQIYQQLPLEPGIIVCTSQDFYLTARRAGLLLFWRYLSYSLNFPKEFNDSTPLWYAPDLGFRNRLVEAYQRGEYQQPNLIVLDNIYQDMPAIKVDKIHDALQIFCDRPCLLLVRGTDPYNYCLAKLGVRPNRMVNFARQLRREVV